MNYNKYKTIHNKEPITEDLIEDHFAQKKGEFIKTLIEIFNRHNKADNRHFGEIIDNMSPPVGMACEKYVWVYVNLIYTYVDIFEPYDFNYYEDHNYGFFAFFFAILLEKNSALMSLYMKNNKRNMSTIPYEKGRDIIIDTWQKAIKELKDSLTQYSPSQFVTMIKKKYLIKSFQKA